MNATVRLMEQNSVKAKSSGPGMEWIIYCEGSCEECNGKGIKLKPTVYECACSENCALKVTRVQIGPGPSQPEEQSFDDSQELRELIESQGTFQQMLEKSLRLRYNIRDYRVEQIKVYKSAHSFALQYFIQAAESEEHISLSYLAKAGEPAYEVDCSGGCVAASAKCTERVTLGDPIKIECTCEGECHMNISTVGDRTELD